MKNYYIFIAILVLGACSNESKVAPDNEKLLKNILITSIDYVDSNSNKVISEFVFSYENDRIKEIVTEGKKHIVFVFQDDKVVEKKYFNHNESLTTIESFVYDPDGKLGSIITFNEMDNITYRRDLIYDADHLIKLVETFFYPTQQVQEYEFIYAGMCIDSVHFSTANQTYAYEYFEEESRQDLNFYIEIMGIYRNGQYAINGITLPIVFSPYRIKSVRGFNSLGEQLFEYQYNHLITNGYYDELYFEWFGQNQEILNATKMECKY